MIYILPTDTCFWIACPIHDFKAYSWIYKIKKRHLDKPLAILVEDFKWLIENTDLNSEQIDFLKEYSKPFTILTNSDHLRLWINYIDPDNNEFVNRDVYKTFAFRVVNNDIEKRLVKENWPLFLTSANLSNQPEIYLSKKIEEEFSYYLERDKIKFVWKNTWNIPENWVSDIFEFKWEGLEVEYLRKN